MSLANFRPFVPDACTIALPQLDPQHPGDIAAAVIGYLILGFNGVQIFFVFANRTFMPIAAKQPHILLLQYFAGVCWVTGNYLISNSFPVEDESYGVYCVFRRFWLAYTLGFCLWMSCMIVRFVRLHVVVMKNKKPKPAPFYFGILLLPVIILSIITLFVESDRSCDYVVGEGEDQVHIIRCKLNTAFAIVVVIYHVAYFLVAIVYSFLLRNIKKSFIEYKELRLQIAAGLIAQVVLVGLSLGGADPYVAGRSVLSLMYVATVTFIQNIAVGKISYDLIFRREAALAEFRKNIWPNSAVPLDPQAAGSSTSGNGIGSESKMIPSPSHDSEMSSSVAI